MAVKQILTGLLAVAALANTAPVDSVDTNEIEQHASIFKRNSWGPAVSTGPTKANIVSANYIFTPGQMPINQTGGLYLWAGMAGDGNSDLIQSIIGSQTSNSWCGATGKEWYIRNKSPCIHAAGTDSFLGAFRLKCTPARWDKSAVCFIREVTDIVL